MRLTTLEKVLHLRRVPLFSEMSGRELRQIAEIAAQESFPAQHLIFREGDPGSKLYLVVDGEVEIFLERQGARTLLAKVQPGAFFGEMSIFDLEPRSASAASVGPLTCLTLSCRAFRDLVFTFPAVVFPVLQHISRNLRKANEAEVRARQNAAPSSS